MGILHQHNGIGYGTRTTKHRNSKRSNGNIIGISLDFLVFQLHWGITGLQHIEANLKDNNSTGNTETIGRDTEELEKKFCLYMRNKAEETDKEMYEKFLEALKSTNYALDNFKNGLKQLLAEHST